MHLIILIAIGVVLGIIIYKYRAKISNLVLIFIFTAFILLALMLSIEKYGLYFHVYLFLGWLACLCFIAFPIFLQIIIQLFGLGVLIFLMIALWIFLIFEVCSDISGFELLGYLSVISLICGAPVSGLCFAFYRTWIKKDKFIDANKDSTN